MDQLQPYHLDVLKEVSNIGVAHAATSLSALVGKTIKMTVPDVRLIPIPQLPQKIGGVETKVAAIFLRMIGDASASLYFVTTTKDAEKLVRSIMKNDSFQLDTPPYDEMGLSAFQEIGNILAGSFLTSLSTFTRLALQPSVPGVAIDMAGAILNEGLISLLQAGDHAIVIDTEIKETDIFNGEMRGQFLFLPDPDSFEVLFRALGVELDE